MLGYRGRVYRLSRSEAETRTRRGTLLDRYGTSPVRAGRVFPPRTANLICRPACAIRRTAPRLPPPPRIASAARLRMPARAEAAKGWREDFRASCNFRFFNGP